MTLKEFSKWCNERACDGYWGIREGVVCIDIMDRFKKIPFWKRKRTWEKSSEKKFAEELVEFTEKRIKELKENNQ